MMNSLVSYKAVPRIPKSSMEFPGVLSSSGIFLSLLELSSFLEISEQPLPESPKVF